MSAIFAHLPDFWHLSFMASSAPILALKDARLAFGDKLLFDQLSLYVSPRDRLCLVGANGTGKSTLMNCLAGMLELDVGERFVQPGTTIALVPQDIAVPEGERVIDFVRGLDEVRDGVRGEKTVLSEHVAEQTMVRLGLSTDMVGGPLSGGENRRAALARAMARQPDVLLLDEPTNHLDLEAIKTLETALNGYPGAFILISHDRAFLNAVSSATLWLQRRHLLRMDHPFSEYENWSEQIIDLEIKENKKLHKLIDRETEWLHRGVTARRKRNQGRLRNLKDLRETRRSRQVGRTTVSMGASEGPPASQLVADIHRIGKQFDGPDGTVIEIVSDFSTRIIKGDRIGLLGPNGAGKTTMLKMLLGELKPDTGRVKMGQRTEPAYFDQARREIDITLTPWQFLCPEGGDQINVRGNARHVVGYLKEFMFDEDDARSSIATLSGGQRNRLMLAKILAEPSNLLVLDEPTNDLDMDTLDQLQETLSNYDGTLIVVSHDRDFLDKLVTSLIVMEGAGDTREYVGGYDDYLRQRKTFGPKKISTKDVGGKGALKTPTKSKDATKLTYKDQRELDGLPKVISNLEAEIIDLNVQLDDPEFFQKNADGFAKAAARLEQAKIDLMASEERWLALEAMQEAFLAGKI